MDGTALVDTAGMGGMGGIPVGAVVLAGTEGVVEGLELPTDEVVAVVAVTVTVFGFGEDEVVVVVAVPVTIFGVTFEACG